MMGRRLSLSTSSVPRGVVRLRAGSQITRVKAPHLSLIAEPAAVAKVIATAAKHVHQPVCR